MTIENARDDCIQDLVDSGKFKRSEVSGSDYGILQTITTCGIIMQPGQSTSEIGAYGRETMDEWELSLECYIREDDDPTDAMGRAWQIHTDVNDAIQSGSNLNGPGNRIAWVSGYNRPRTAIAEIAGLEFIPVFITVTVRE